MVGHIDTHHHFLPRVYVDTVGVEKLAAVTPNNSVPEWSVESALASMDRLGTVEAILSISSGAPLPNEEKLLRQCNDAAADLRSRHPGRFGSFASLPLPDIDASLDEIAYSLDTLNADGVIVFTNYDGKYLGDPHYAPVMDELNRRRAAVFIHPAGPTYHLAGLPPAAVLEFPFDTTRAAASLILSGGLERWPDIKFILSHAGGVLPFLSERLAGAVMMNPALAERVGSVEDAIRCFWFDTALSFNAPAIAALMEVADPKRIVFGTDYPLAPRFAIEKSAERLGQMPMSEDQRAMISRRNAERLLGRMAN